jgi:hypothetical protein
VREGVRVGRVAERGWEHQPVLSPGPAGLEPLLIVSGRVTPDRLDQLWSED